MKKSMMKIMSMALVIASVMSISAMSVSAKEYNNETYKNRTKSTYTGVITVPEANYERPPEPKQLSDIKFNYTEDGRIVMRFDKYLDYVIDNEKNIAYGLYYFDDGDVMMGIDKEFPGYDNLKGYALDPYKTITNRYIADYSEKPDDRRVGDFIIGRGSYVEIVNVISPETTKPKIIEKDGTVSQMPTNPLQEREFKSEWIVKKYLGEGGLVTLPEGAEAIAPTVFQNNKTITKIVFPKSFKNVPANAFLNCSASHFVFKSSESIYLTQCNFNNSGKTVLEFYTPAKSINIWEIGENPTASWLNPKTKTSKSSFVIYCYGDPKDSLLAEWGIKAIYTKKIAYP